MRPLDAHSLAACAESGQALYRLRRVFSRSANEGIETWNVTPKPLGPALKRDYPEVEKATRLNWDRFILFTVGDKKINLRGTMADPDFLTMFRFPFEEGDENTALNRPNDIVLTRRTAKTLFGDADPMGKTLRLDNKYDMTVTGVMKDLPGITQFDFEYVLPWPICAGSDRTTTIGKTIPRTTTCC
jgi:putative ABC transport system permease protein